MPSRTEIVSFVDSPPPPGADPRVVAGAGPGTGIEVADPDPAGRGGTTGPPGGSGGSGLAVLQLEHVGSTAGLLEP